MFLGREIGASFIDMIYLGCFICGSRDDQGRGFDIWLVRIGIFRLNHRCLPLSFSNFLLLMFIDLESRVLLACLFYILLLV